MVEGKQCTITWYVNGNKASHVNPKVVDELLEDMNKHLGYLVVTRGGKFFF